MGSNWMKAPLIAVLYAAMLQFIAVFVPFSSGYNLNAEFFSMPTLGYLILIGYCLWISVILVLVFWSADRGGWKLAGLALASCIGLQWVTPMFEEIIFGDPGNITTYGDSMKLLLIAGLGTIVAMLLCTLLYKNEQSTTGAPLPTFKIKRIPLLVKTIALPFIYMFIYLICWYFLGWKNADVRLFWGGGEQDLGFVQSMIDMLLNTPRIVPMALVRGLMYAVFSFPLCLLLRHKRAMYMITNTMLILSHALTMLIPNPLLPEAVRIPLLIHFAAALLPFGVLTSFLLHTSFDRKEPEPPPQQQRPQGARPQQARPAQARPAPARR